MRRTDNDIRRRIADLMRAAAGLLRSALMLTVAVVAMLAVVSCSGGGGGDDPDVPGPDTPGPNQPDPEKPIAFSAIQQEETDVTRSRSPLESISESFVVYGYKNMSQDETTQSYGPAQVVFPGYNVIWSENTANSTVSNTNDWEYVNKQSSGQAEQTLKYWDMSASAYRFFGHIGGEVGGNETTKTISFHIDATNDDNIAAAPYISRLWFSTGNVGEPQFGKPVQLMFLKPFARVRFMFTQSYPDAVLLLGNKNFGPTSAETIITAGDFTVSYPLTETETEESFSIENGTGINAFEDDYTESTPIWYGVYAPQSLGSFKVTVTVNGSPEKTAVVPAEYMNWQPGFQYTYIFKVTEQGGIEIQVVETAVTTWTEYPGVHEVYNW